MIIGLYNIGIRCYAGLIRLAALWNPKAKSLIEGWLSARNITRGNIEHKIEGKVSPDFELIWVHCASLGEFEMAKPIAAALQAASNQRHILFSFFSPSGFNYAKLDLNQTKVYLPLDGAYSAARWMQQWQPQSAIFIRYEFWYHYMNQLILHKIPTFALGVSIAPNHSILSRPAAHWRNKLQKFNAIGFINQNMVHLAQSNNFQNAFVFGDSKFNRAYDRTQLTIVEDTLTTWIQNKPTLILGSAWQPEINLLSQFIKQNPNALEQWQIIIAPHNIDAKFSNSISSEFEFLHPIKISHTQPQSVNRLVVLDTIGQLAQCYKYGKIAFIGGAFGAGLHNTIEATAFGLPTMFGPNHSKFPEAAQFIHAGIGFCVKNQTEFNETLLHLIQSLPPNHPHPLSKIAIDFVKSNRADVTNFVNVTYPNAFFKVNT